MNFLVKLLEIFAKKTAASAAPFALQEIAALSKFAAAYFGAELDFSQTAEERKVNRQIAVNDLKSFLEACKEEGIELLTDVPSLFLAAGATDLMGEFGFDQTANVAAGAMPE